MIVRGYLPALAVLLFLATPVPAAAHRLDEYLQATRLSIDVDRVGLEMDLTAGVAVAPEIFGWIDTDRNGRISDIESDAYARQLLGSLQLSIDDRPVRISLDQIHVPSFREMSLGVGIIRVRATALCSASAGRHHVSFVNTHRPETSVYLVNPLAPADPRIQIAGQRRDRGQHGLTVDYVVKDDGSWARTCSLLVAVAMAGALVVTRRPRAHRQS